MLAEGPAKQRQNNGSAERRSRRQRTWQKHMRALCGREMRGREHCAGSNMWIALSHRVKHWAVRPEGSQVLLIRATGMVIQANTHTGGAIGPDGRPQALDYHPLSRICRRLEKSLRHETSTSPKKSTIRGVD